MRPEAMAIEAFRVFHAEFGIPDDYGRDPLMATYREAEVLEDVGPNIVGRPQKLTPETARAWRELVAAAAEDDVNLLLVSGFRSIEYQAELIRNKLMSGQALADILCVNVAPGFSQHHTGNAIDIATPGCKPLTEEFEGSDAFAWLTQHAGRFGFSLSYPRGNPEGINYEPWHWYRSSP